MNIIYNQQRILLLDNSARGICSRNWIQASRRQGFAPQAEEYEADKQRLDPTCLCCQKLDFLQFQSSYIHYTPTEVKEKEIWSIKIEKGEAIKIHQSQPLG